MQDCSTAEEEINRTFARLRDEGTSRQAILNAISRINLSLIGEAAEEGKQQFSLFKER